MAEAFHSPDPVLATVRRQVEGSHWLLKPADCRRLLQSSAAPKPECWKPFLREIGGPETEQGSFETFLHAWRFTRERVSEVESQEALLVSIG